MSVLVRPFPRTTPGHVLQWYGPNFHTIRCCVMLLAVGAYHFFWEQVVVCLGRKTSLCLSESRGRSRCRGERGLLLCGAVVFLAAVAGEFEYL